MSYESINEQEEWTCECSTFEIQGDTNQMHPIETLALVAMQTNEYKIDIWKKYK